MNDKIRIDNTNMYMHIPYSAAKAIDEYMKKNKKINAVKVLREVLRDAGIYFNSEHPDSIAVSLNLLIQDESVRKTLGSRARYLSQAYSWERCAQETFSFLSSVYKLHF